MRAVVLLLLILASTAASAQGDALFTDPSGDQSVQFAGADAPADGHEEADLVAAGFSENPGDFDVWLRFSTLERGTTSTGGAVGGMRASLYFTYEDKPYRVSFYHFVDLDGNPNGFVYLEEYDAGRDDYAAVDRLDDRIDETTSTLSATIPRDLIYGSDGAPVSTGGMFTDFWAENIYDMQIFADGLGVPSAEHAYDRMPDDGFADVTLSALYGVEQQGHARLSSDEPFRISNGEATTFIFEVQAQNTDDDDDRFDLAAEDVPDNWVVAFPEEHLRLEGGETHDTTVLLTVPFQHEHGTVRNFTLTMTSRTDPDTVGRLSMGIRYTAVPQPSGHHPFVYLHTGDPFSFPNDAAPALQSADAYMNTMEKDELDSGVPATPWDFDCTADGRAFAFPVYLQPGLGMGLDFDMDAAGSLELHFDMPLPGTAVVDGAIYVEGPDASVSTWDHFQGDAEEYKVASLVATQPIDVQAHTEATATVTVMPEAPGDYVPYQSGSSLLMIVVIHEGVPNPACVSGTGEEPRILPGSNMALPLLEYHDDVSDYISTLAGLRLEPDADQERMANPGRTVVFEASLRNSAAAGVFDLTVTGEHAEWARVLGDAHVELDAGEERALAIAVDVPDDALDGERADLVLQVVSADADGRQALLRYIVIVDTDEEHPDDNGRAAALQGELAGKKSPGPALPVILLGVVLLAARRRH